MQMIEVQSNNPYRNSMPPQLPPAAAGQKQYRFSAHGLASPVDGSSPTYHPPSPPPLAKFPSSTTTIAEEPEHESDNQHPGHSRTPTPPVIVKACDEKEVSDNVVITIHPTTSASTVQQPEYPAPIRTNTHPHPRQSIGEPCPVWPARRFMQKQVMAKNTKWIVIKVILALVFVVGAIAIGFGISKVARGGA